MKYISGVKEICANYDYFIFDVWGVIHDGLEAYPDVKETIEFLRNQNKKICFLSNAPRRASKVADVLAGYGIDKNMYDFILTSGEAAFLDFKENQENNFSKYQKNYLYIGPQKDIDLLDGLNYNMVDNAKDADFAIVTGFEGEESTVEEKMPQALDALENNLELICVNPDLLVVRKNGSKMICAGALAKKYQELGGKVSFYGKPYGKIYEIVCKIFNQTDTSKMLAIGDGLETDIKGSNNFNIDNILLTGGILSNVLNIKYWEDADKNELEKIFNQENIFPKFVMTNLKK